MLEYINLLRNIGQFDSDSNINNKKLDKLTIIYGENGRGKTTLSNIFQSLSQNNSSLIEDRLRLREKNDPHYSNTPHIIISSDKKKFIYQNGNWVSHFPEVFVFDDNFTSQNVCSGIEVASQHRQNLHELIIGNEGVVLNSTLQEKISKIEEHNKSIREKEAAIPISIRGKLTIDDFCALTKRENISNDIQEIHKNIEAAKSSDVIKRQNKFQNIVLPVFNIENINELLKSDLPSLQKEAEILIQHHLKKLGKNSESWIAEGMNKINNDYEGKCPFCVQNLNGSSFIIHYQGYFSESYSNLKRRILVQTNNIKSQHSTDIQMTFQNSVYNMQQLIEFWSKFINIQRIEINYLDIINIWKSIINIIFSILEQKCTAPLEKMVLPEELNKMISVYQKYREEIIAISKELENYNLEIDLVKERISNADLSILNNDMEHLKLIEKRYDPSVIKLCEAYLDEKNEKKKTEKERDIARQNLDEYRDKIFPYYKDTINNYLQRLLAGFRLGTMNVQNNRVSTSCSYNFLINNHSVPINSEAGASFKNTLSAGDRNTLSLSFFFALLDKDSAIKEKIVIFDDPMTSLDVHRTRSTIRQIIDLTNRVKQVIVLSHQKTFLCDLWDDAKNLPKVAFQIKRSGSSSKLDIWDVDQDCFTEHDKRHALILSYLEQEDPNKQREVASALRPTLEAFLRVAYPKNFKHGSLLGKFIEDCKNAFSKGEIIMKKDNVEELNQIKDYSNRFHHDTNPAYYNEIINDQELIDFCKRTLVFLERNK